VNKFKRHLSVANVLSCIALFVALGGAAYAAGKLGPKAVKAKNIANEAVTAAKLKKGAVISSKLATNSVINSKLANGAVNGAKIANGAITSGKLGKKAVTANALAAEAVTAGKLGNGSVSSTKLSPSFYLQLLKNVTYVTETSVNDSADSKTVNAVCPVGKEVLGGGVRINGGSTDPKVGVAPSLSAPLISAANGRVGWSAGGREIGEEPLSWQVVAYAICAEL
jgi:hypothetical protein